MTDWTRASSDLDRRRLRLLLRRRRGAPVTARDERSLSALALLALATVRLPAPALVLPGLAAGDEACGTPPRAALAVASIALATAALLYGLVVPVLPLLAVRHGASSVGVGVLFAAYAGALVAVTPLAGLAIDRAGTRTPMLGGLVCLAAAVALLGVGLTLDLSLGGLR